MDSIKKWPGTPQISKTRSPPFQILGACPKNTPLLASSLLLAIQLTTTKNRSITHFAGILRQKLLHGYVVGQA
jgi:hypothetical protein